MVGLFQIKDILIKSGVYLELIEFYLLLLPVLFTVYHHQVIAKADFTQIRKNQQDLVNKNKIQNREEVTLGDEQRKSLTIRVKETDTKLDLIKPFENAYINNSKDMANVRLSFLKSVYGNKYVAILGALGQPGNTVKILTDKGSQLGVYKVLDSITGEVLKSIKNVKGNTIYDLYLFDKKV